MNTLWAIMPIKSHFRKYTKSLYTNCVVFYSPNYYNNRK